MSKFILVTGNPVDGLSFFGPFNDPEEAHEFAEGCGTGDWWVAMLEEPE